MTTDNGCSALLSITVTRTDTTTVLTVCGDLDLTTAPHLTEAVEAATNELAPRSALIVDLTEVPFLASVGMTVLIEARRRVGDGQKFAVVAAGPTTHRPLRLMGLDNMFALYTDIDSALAAVDS